MDTKVTDVCDKSLCDRNLSAQIKVCCFHWTPSFNESISCRDKAHAQNDSEKKSFWVLKNRVNIDKTINFFRASRMKVNNNKIQCKFCSNILKVYERLQDLKHMKLWQVFPLFKWFWFVLVHQWLKPHHACVRNAKTNLVLVHYTRNTTW